MSTPSARAGDAIRAHHRRLLEALERHLAALSARAAAADGVAEAQALARFLAEELRPHARGEERALYPARLHLEKEERVYLPLFEAHLSPEEQRRVLEAMHDEPASTPAHGSPVVDVREPVVDVRELPPPRRHPVIFDAFGRLAPGQAFVLVNDHDPRPLYYQFAAEMPGRFTWEYLEAGPDVWRVRIGKPAA